MHNVEESSTSALLPSPFSLLFTLRDWKFVVIRVSWATLKLWLLCCRVTVMPQWWDAAQKTWNSISAHPRPIIQ